MSSISVSSGDSGAMFSGSMKSTESVSRHCIRCTEEVSNPILLQCFHSFCLGCLDSLVHRPSPESFSKSPSESHFEYPSESPFKSPSKPPSESLSKSFFESPSFLTRPGVVVCPDCLEQTVVVEEHLDQLPQSSIFGRRILDINKILRRSTDGETCAGCCSVGGGHANYTRRHVDAYCLDCQEFFCDACAANHTHFRFAASHRLITGSDAVARKPRDLIEGTSRFCKVHEAEREAFYCRSCDECPCAVCYSEKHESCEEVEPIEENQVEMEKLAGRIIEGLRGRIDEERELAERLEREERQLTRRAKGVGDELKRRSCAVTDHVTRSANDLLHQLENQVEQRGEIYENANGAVTQQVEDLKVFRETVTRLLEKASLAHLVALDSGGCLDKVERETIDFSESWRAMLVSFEESRDLEEMMGDDSIGEVLGRLQETDSDDDYLDDDGSEPDHCTEYSVGNAWMNETKDANEPDKTEMSSEARVEVKRTAEEKEPVEGRESKGEIVDREEAVLEFDDVELGEVKTDNWEEREETWDEKETPGNENADVKNEIRFEMTRDESVAINDPPTRSMIAMGLNEVAAVNGSVTEPKMLDDKKGKKKMKANGNGNIRMFTVLGDKAGEGFEFTVDSCDRPHPTMTMTNHRSIDGNDQSGTDYANTAAMRESDQSIANGDTKESDPEVTSTIGDRRPGPWLQATTAEGQPGISSSSGTFNGKRDFRSTFHQFAVGCRNDPETSDQSTAKDPEISLLWNWTDQSGGGGRGGGGGERGRERELPSPVIPGSTSLIKTSISADGMNQNRADMQETTGQTRFSTIDHPITAKRNGADQESTRGHPIAARQNVSESVSPVSGDHPITGRQIVSDNSNHPIKMRQTGAELDTARTSFPVSSAYPSGSIQNWSGREIVDPEVLFFYDAATYRGTQPTGSGTIKVLLGQEDNTNTSRIHLEWDEEFQHLTPDSRLELLTLDPETYMFQISCQAELGRESSAVQFKNGEDAEQFENTLNQLIGQMDSLCLNNKAMPC